jgi:1-acyl-sn-glycerol-3-phosphate acyltransferase
MAKPGSKSLLMADGKYNHKSHEFRRRLLRMFWGPIAFPWLAKVNSIEGMENIPQTGPAVLCYNHINFMDPLLTLYVVRSRFLVPIAKVESFDYPIIGSIPRMYGVISIRRGKSDRVAVRQSLEVLKSGEMLLVSPEGTRNPAMIEAKTGSAFLATRANVPVILVAIDNTLGYPTYPFSKRWKQPGANIKFSKPFRFRGGEKAAGHDGLRKMTDELMYILATMLPPHRRGYYSDLSKATQDTIEWL